MSIHKPTSDLCTLLPPCVNSKNVLIGSVMCRDCQGLLYLPCTILHNIVELQTAFLHFDHELYIGMGKKRDQVARNEVIM